MIEFHKIIDDLKNIEVDKYSGKKVDMKEMQCYNCQVFDHYARGCRRKKESRVKDNDEIQYAHTGGSNYDDILLMENTQ